MDFKDLIIKYPPKQMVAIPLLILVAALLILGANYHYTGSPVKLGVEFTGGTVVTVPAALTLESVTKKLSDYPVTETRNIGNRYLIQFGPMSEEKYKELALFVNSEFSDAEIRYMGPIYSEGLQRQAIRYVPMAFIFMAIVVFAIYREFVPSFTIVFSGFSDIIIAAASMNITGVALSLGTVAALLMLIGYTVDSNILLTTRVLNRRGGLDEKILGAMRTGFAMTGTTLAAIATLFIVSTFSYLVSTSFSRIDILSDISIVLIFGLVADLMNTWMLNANLLRWYIERRPARRQKK